MLNDIINDIGNAVGVAGIAILLIATYRAFGIGRALMRGVHRNRAYWTAATAIDLILFTAASYLPSSNPLGPLAFLVTFVVLFAFIDTSIRVAREADFFHRSILGWERVRKPFAVLLLASSAAAVGAVFVFGLGPSGNNPTAIVGVLQLFVVAALILSWGAVALTIGARRSADTTLRRFAKMLGLTVLSLVLFLTIWIPFAPFSLTVQDFGNTLSDFFALAGYYFLYLAVMSLSPVGHIEKGAGASPSGALGGTAPPSSP